MATMDRNPGSGIKSTHSRLKTAGAMASILCGYAVVLWLWPKVAAALFLGVAALCVVDAIAMRRVRAAAMGLDRRIALDAGIVRSVPKLPAGFGPKAVLVGVGKVIGWAVIVLLVLLPLLIGWSVVSGIVKLFRKPRGERDWPPQDSGGDTPLVGAGLRPPPSTRRGADAKPFPN